MYFGIWQYTKDVIYRKRKNGEQMSQSDVKRLLFKKSTHNKISRNNAKQ